MPGIIRDFTVCSKFHTHARPNWPIKKWQTKASWISRQQWRYRRRSSNNPIFFFFLFKISLETKIIIHNRDGKPSANIGSWDEKKQNRLIQFFFFLFFFRKNLKSAHSPDLFFFFLGVRVWPQVTWSAVCGCFWALYLRVCWIQYRSKRYEMIKSIVNIDGPGESIALRWFGERLGRLPLFQG